MAITGQRTTANAKASSSSSSSGSSKKKSSSKKTSSSKSGREFVFGDAHPFRAGEEVRIQSIDGQTSKKATVGKDGSLKVSGLKDGIYTATQDAPEQDQDLVDTNAPAPQYLEPREPIEVTFTVKNEKAARKAKYDRYGGAQPLAAESARSQR